MFTTHFFILNYLYQVFHLGSVYVLCMNTYYKKVALLNNQFDRKTTITALQQLQDESIIDHFIIKATNEIRTLIMK